MGASPSRRCEAALKNVRRTFENNEGNKARAKAMIRLLKVSVRNGHPRLLFDGGVADICADILREEPKCAPLRELALVALLCLSLDPSVKQDLVTMDNKNKSAIKYVIRAVRGE